MKQRFGSRRLPAFTLVELLVVVAILSVLAGLVYSSTGGVREKARQVVCISNLRQIGQAIAMYRQDYGGSDTPGWPAEMGLPPLHTTLVGLERRGGAAYLPGGRQVLFCPDDPPRGRAASSYGWNPWGPGTRFDGPDNIPLAVPPFPEVVARRGSDFPLVYDSHHSFPRLDRPAPGASFHIVLRLDGRVEAGYSSEDRSWEW